MKKRKIFLIAGIVFVAILVCWVVIYNYKNDGFATSDQVQHPEKPPRKPKPIPPKPRPSSFPIGNIPTQGKHEWGEERNLTPAEEKIVIESLSSQVGINKDKSFFDYKWGFVMIPGIREIREDTDNALYLFTDQDKFFVKVNNFSDLARFEYEKESMLAINEAVPDFAPHPLYLGNLPNGGKFLVVNFIEARWHDRLIIENQKSLAKKLAQLHQKKSPNSKFGFCIGNNNQWKDNWAKFFYENRWLPIWKRFLQKYPREAEMIKWGEIIGKKVIPDLLDNLPVEPVLIHGNLDFDSWDISSQTNQPWVFDTHSYYGHNEMDLSLIHYSSQDIDWIGGRVPEGCKGEFSESEFLAEYQRHNPLPPGFEERKMLYRLYDYLHRGIVISDPNRKWRKKFLNMMKKLGQKYG